MPMPSSQNDILRWQHTNLRLNILNGTWEEFVLQTMQEQYGLNSVRNMGRPSLAVNLLENTVSQIAILYDSNSKVSNESLTPETEAVWSSITDSCHLWQLLQRNNRDTLGLRENFVQVVPTESGPQLELISPSEIVVDKTSGDASNPTALRRSRQFQVQDDIVDAWEIWDISDKENPIFKIEDTEGNIITRDVLPGSPDSYLYMNEDGSPYLPFQLYRAQYTSQTFDPYTGMSLVDGTLDIAVRWTMFGVCLRNNSWGQWVMIDGVVPGTSGVAQGLGNLTTSASLPETIELAPNSLLNVNSVGDKQAQIKQLEPGPMLQMAQAILLSQNTILNNAGIHPDDIQSGSSPESGVAISLKKSSQRKLALATVPNFRRADESLFSLISKVSNTFMGTDLPTSGWRIDYQLPETSTSEFIEDLNKDKSLIQLGLLSPVGLARKLFGLETDAEAVKYLQDVKLQNSMFPTTL